MTTNTEHKPFYSRQLSLDVLCEWFGQCTSLYFLSACCMLAGVFMVSPGSHTDSWEACETMLTGVLELYQVLLIAAAAMLFRAKQTRPAATLGLLAVFFLLDTTYQMDVTATFDRGDRLVAGMWLAMVALKLVALRWAFQIRTVRFELIVPFLAAAAIAFVPQILTRTTQANDPIVHLAAAWFGAGLVAVVLIMRRSRNAAFDPAVSRAVDVAWRFWLVAYLYHLISWIRIFDIAIFTPVVYLMPIPLLCALVVKRERYVWISCAVALCFTLCVPRLMAPTAAAAALVFIAQGLRLNRPSCYVGAVLACHIAVWTVCGHHGWLSLTPQCLWQLVATAAALVVIAVRFRMPAALLPLLLGLYPLATLIDAHGTRGWGVVLIVGAFAALGLGFLINWLQPHDSACAEMPI